MFISKWAFEFAYFFNGGLRRVEGHLRGGDRAAGALGTPVPLSSVEGRQASCSTSAVKAVEAVRKDREEGSWGVTAMRGTGSRAGRPGELKSYGARPPRPPQPPQDCPSPAFPSGREAAERPLLTRTIPLECEASARAAGGPPTGCSSGLWLSQMSLFSYSSLLEPRFKEWLRWNKIVLGNKVNTLRTFMHLLRPQKAAWTMVIKFAVRVKSWPSLLGMGFSCRHSSLGIYLAWGIIYLASRNLCTVVMNPCFEDAGFRAAVGQCSLPGPIFHYCVLPAHSQEPNY